MRHVDIRDKKTGLVVVPSARWCASFWCKFKGLMGRRGLRVGEALLMVEHRDSRALTAIHMLFVSFDLGVVWINTAGQVVDKVLARPWRPSYAPKSPARYVLEAAPELLQRIQVGDQWEFVDVVAMGDRP